jgi:hypothetical protein
MSQQSVRCPHCGRDFELGEAWLDEEVASRLGEEREKLVAVAQRQAREDLGLELQATQEELKDKSQKLAEAKKTELELRKKERELKERQEGLELEILKGVEEERGKIVEEEKAKAAEQQQLKLREKENHIKSLNDQIDELKRRAEVGSQEGQGEALEGELIDILRRQFPFDEYEEIKKGQRGADILQRVRNQSGNLCGTILWESKNTKAFVNDWIDKLKKDQQEAGADLAVLMAMAMPTEVDDFDLYHDVWVTSFASAMSLCGVLRHSLIELERARFVSRGKESMKDVIYGYITGNEFSQRVKLIHAAYQQMQADLESEKNSMKRIWKKREKQISTVLDNVSGMWGEIDGLMIGESASLPRIEALSLESIAEGEDD